MFSIPETLACVQLIQPRTTNGGFTTSYVSMKNFHRAYVVAHLTQAAGHATALTLSQANTVAGGAAKAATNNVRIFANEDTAASDTLVEKTAAKAYTVAADVKNKLVVFEIDPATVLDVASGFDCVGLTVANSGEGTNFASVVAYMVPRYAGDSGSAITD